jgi:hypothetical protein
MRPQPEAYLLAEVGARMIGTRAILGYLNEGMRTVGDGSGVISRYRKHLLAISPD